MSNKSVSLTGYDLKWMYATEQHYKLMFKDDVKDWPPDQDFVITWDWYPSDSGEFLVLLQVKREPSEADPGDIRVSAIARFAVLDTSAAVPFEHFVVHDAPMMMFPFINEIVSSLTKHSLYEPEYLSVSHFAKELEGNDFAASLGLAILKSEPIKAAQLGISPEVVQPMVETRQQERRTIRSKSK